MEKPKNLLERKTFETILWNVYMIEGDVRFRIRSENFDSLRLQTTVAINEIYKKNNTNHNQFMQSYIYYMNDPDLSSEIMKNIVNRLVELQAKEEAKQREKDSIASINRVIEKDSLVSIKFRAKDSIIFINKLFRNTIWKKDKIRNDKMIKR